MHKPDVARWSQRLWSEFPVMTVTRQSVRTSQRKQVNHGRQRNVLGLVHTVEIPSVSRAHPPSLFRDKGGVRGFWLKNGGVGDAQGLECSNWFPGRYLFRTRLSVTCPSHVANVTKTERDRFAADHHLVPSSNPTASKDDDYRQEGIWRRRPFDKGLQILPRDLPDG